MDASDSGVVGASTSGPRASVDAERPTSWSVEKHAAITSYEHTPAWHPSDPAQALPQPPQFAALVARSTQEDPHWVSPKVWHEMTHWPAAQRCPAGHGFPQAPQDRASEAVSTHPAPGHATVPSRQAQAPCTHASLVPQAVPHPPQWRSSAARSTHSRPHRLFPALQSGPILGHPLSRPAAAATAAIAAAVRTPTLELILSSPSWSRRAAP